MPRVSGVPVYNFNARTAFLTAPRCDLAKDLVVARAKAKWPNLKWIVVAMERHSPSTEENHNPNLIPTHLHVVLSFSVRKHFRKSDWADHLFGKHPNIQVPKNLTDVMKYVIKDDPSPLEDPMGTILAVLAKSATKCVSISRMIHDHKSLKEIDIAVPGYLLLHLKAVETYAATVALWEMQSEVTVRKDFFTTSADPTVVSIAGWLTDAIATDRVRAFREEQLWITAPSAFGKSMVFDLVSQHYKVYTPPMNSDFWPGYSDEYDVIIWDEFHGSHCRLQLLNRILEGRPVRIKIYGGQVVKRKPLPCIVLSNLSPIEAYPTANQGTVDALCKRLKIVNPSAPFGQSMFCQ